MIVHPAFQVVPSNTCVPCGGSAEFNCSTTAPANLGGGNIVEGVGGQLWMIRNPNGTVTNLSSIMPDMVPAGYEFVAPFLNDFTGLRVLNTTSIWNGTTFQCIAFDPSNLGRQNDSAAAVTLEVGGKCRNILSTVFPQFLPAGTINFSACQDAGTIRWREQNEGGVNITWQQ